MFKVSCDANLTVNGSKSELPSGSHPKAIKCLSGVETKTRPTFAGMPVVGSPKLVTY